VISGLISAKTVYFGTADLIVFAQIANVQSPFGRQRTPDIKYNIQYQASSIKIQVSSIKYQESSNKYQVSSIKNPVPGFRIRE